MRWLWRVRRVKRCSMTEADSSPNYRDRYLCTVMKKWTRTDADFATRVGHLMNGSGLNESFRVNDLTVHDDGAVDVLTGSGGQDWFLLNLDGDGGAKDQATDMKAFEARYAQDIDFINGL